MTSQRLLEILKFLDTLDTQLNLQKTLESIKEALNELVDQPAQPQYQQALATALASFEAAATKLDLLITPSQFEEINDMGGIIFFDLAIAEKVRNSVEKNAMTPAVARDFVQDLATKRSSFLTTVRQARQSLEKLGIKASDLEPGSASLAFLIPWDIFDNHLATFAKELSFISRLMGHLSEGLTGQAEQVELEGLASSLPTVALAARVPLISVLATIVNKFLDAWTKIEKIRKMRAELSDMGLRKWLLTN